ncbi:hypothetical protein ACKLNR_002391 [Fusarium oxysporum f. sp. zingiberi]
MDDVKIRAEAIYNYDAAEIRRVRDYNRDNGLSNWSPLARNQVYRISCWHRLRSFLLSNVSSNETHPTQIRNLI